jgi:hypothetical protein
MIFCAYAMLFVKEDYRRSNKDRGVKALVVN